MGKRHSLMKQINNRVNDMKLFGVSKHLHLKKINEDRQAQGMNKAKSTGELHSYRSAKMAKDTAKQAARWIRENYPGVKDIGDIKKAHVQAYADYLVAEKELSPSTIHSYIWGITKVADIKSGEIKKPPRRYKDFDKNKNDKTTEAAKEEYKDVIKFIKATGLRRSEIKDLEKKQIHKGDFGKVQILVPKGSGSKANRPRVINVINKNKDFVLSMASRIEEFSHIPADVHTHFYRREFAAEAYKYAMESGFMTGDSYTRQSDNKTFDKGALQEVSKQLGHNRLDVVVRNYLS